MQNNDLYEISKKFVYAKDYEDLNVFSKSFLHSITVPHFSQTNNFTDYMMLYIDFDNMNDINKNGIEAGDKILHDTIEIILSTLPHGTSCFRHGGDEFLFIFSQHNLKKQDISDISIISSVNNALKENAEKLQNATVG